MPQIDLGQHSAKRTSTDDLLATMRDIVIENPAATRSQCVEKWIENVRNDDVMVYDALRYAGNLIVQRCVTPDDAQPRRTPIREPDMGSGQHGEEPEERQTEERDPAALSVSVADIVRDAMHSQIVLWSWPIPGVGKPLHRCTGDELRQSSSLSGRFMLLLADTLDDSEMVEAHYNEDQLQSFWLNSQQSRAEGAVA